jgi:hypothetical protein
MKKQLSNSWLRSAMLAVAVAAAVSAVAQSSDPDAPTPLSGNRVEGMANGKKATLTFYSFAAGPGDLRLTIDSTSDQYSVLYTIEVLSADDFESIEAVSAMATADSKRVVKTITLAGRESLLLKIATPKDDTVKWLKYKIRLDGAVEAGGGALVSAIAPATDYAVPAEATMQPAVDQTMAVPPQEPATPELAVSPEPEAGAAPPAPQANPMFAIAQTVPGMGGDGGPPTSKFLTKLVNGLNALQSSGTLMVEMKDGTVQQIDLAKVRKMSVRKQ